MKPKRVMWIAAAVMLITTVSGFLLLRSLRRFLYPEAPPMPPAVSQTTEALLSQLELILRTKAPQLLDRLQPGLSMEQIKSLEQRANLQLSTDLRALYLWRNGCGRGPTNQGGGLIDGPIAYHRFLPLEEALGLDNPAENRATKAPLVQKAFYEAFAGHRKSWVTLFDDGSGDGYFFDPKRAPAKGAVFYCFAEDRQYVFFPSARNLLAGIVACYERGAFTWQDSKLTNNFVLAEKVWLEFGSSDVR